MTTEDTVYSHFYEHFDNLQLSSNEFYLSLETLVKSYEYPDVVCKREFLQQSGMFSGKREYLKISRKMQNFLVCAAPFGKSFFISWWYFEGTSATTLVIGKLFGKDAQKRAAQKTFFQLDTEMMFGKSIHSILKLSVSRLKLEHGLTKPADLLEHQTTHV